MARESTLWSWLRKADNGNPTLMLGRMENLVEVGRPDVDGIWRGVTFQLELKVAKRPSRRTTKLAWGSPVKDNQVEWILRRLAAGGAAAWLLQVGEGPERAVYLLHGAEGPWLINGVTESELRERALLVDPQPFDVIMGACAIRKR